MARSGLLLEAGLPVAMTSSQRGWAPIAAPARRIYSSVPTEVSYWTRAPLDCQRQNNQPTPCRLLLNVWGPIQNVWGLIHFVCSSQYVHGARSTVLYCTVLLRAFSHFHAIYRSFPYNSARNSYFPLHWPRYVANNSLRPEDGGAAKRSGSAAPRSRRLAGRAFVGAGRRIFKMRSRRHGPVEHDGLPIGRV